jgi:hypothetical protein
MMLRVNRAEPNMHGCNSHVISKFTLKHQFSVNLQPQSGVTMIPKGCKHNRSERLIQLPCEGVSVTPVYCVTMHCFKRHNGFIDFTPDLVLGLHQLF